jgi:hypothetical protein
MFGILFILFSTGLYLSFPDIEIINLSKQSSQGGSGRNVWLGQFVIIKVSDKSFPPSPHFDLSYFLSNFRTKVTSVKEAIPRRTIPMTIDTVSKNFCVMVVFNRKPSFAANM